MSAPSVPDFFQGYGVTSSEKWNEPELVKYKHKPLNANDVVIKVHACGVCGSEIHTVKANWGPLLRNDSVVGHEIVGNVVWVGENAKDEFKIGQRVGVGAQSGCCGECENCLQGYEQNCKFTTLTYNWVDTRADNYVTQGGYADYAVADFKCTYPIPEELPSNFAAPLLCGGLTVFTPLYRWLGENGKGKTVGITGIGGLGHMAILFAKALGADVVAISRSNAKKEHSLKMGAVDFIATGEDPEWFTKNDSKFDYILNCASGFSGIDFDKMFQTLKLNGEIVSVGAPSQGETISFSPWLMLFKNLRISGSVTGSKKDALKMLEVASAHKVHPWIEELPISAESCGEALTKTDNGEVRYRFVLTEFEKAFSS